jgi:drug/metabolite transporter (DMT)-like permease
MKLSRLQADLLLLLVALIWGAAFVAQKDVLAHIGSYTFIAARFALSALLIAPLAWREHARKTAPLAIAHAKDLTLLCIAFSAAVILQQVGIEKTTITNAGFFTGLYVLFVPVICALIYKQALSHLIFPAALLSVAGVFLLGGGSLTTLTSGDALVLLCAVGFAFQIALIGRIMGKVAAPFRLCFIQYSAVALVALLGALLYESPTWEGLRAAALPILYAGAISGGIAYTVQVIAQQFTPASDSAVILSGEAVFAAIFGAVMNGERLTSMGLMGCGLITAAILLVESGPYLFKKRRRSS